MTASIFKKLMVFTESDSLRDLFETLHNFGYHNDFTYMEEPDTDVRKFMRAFVISRTIDCPKPIWTIRQAQKYATSEGEPLTEKEIDNINFWFKELGVL